ncbi:MULTISPECIES: hypothetical protein [Streptomyces]|uniref:hypothetical protein n=1 Tax=Streptomyces TaxID=1883 RepID=UPI001315C0AF|nr:MULTISPECIES: hypothetical protein [Streptomyces]QGZ52177.1 hypothetical protein GPZ77_30865 [Streptomyces sp. QHH-9511]GGT73954.1 hypothetical protein GCM10010272_16710 [Streptomyces lateritius]
MTSTMDRLKVLFEEIGGYQQAIDQGMLFTEARPEMYRRLLEAAILLPPGNGHIWNDYRLWVMQGWASALQNGGDAEAEPWREFLGEITEVLGPAPD